MEDAEIRKLAALERGHWWYKERRSILTRELRHLAASGCALDIGAAGGGKNPPSRIPHPRHFHLHDLGAEITEKLGRQRALHRHPRIQDPDAAQGAGRRDHGRSPASARPVGLGSTAAATSAGGSDGRQNRRRTAELVS